jgi:hypothetical protein
VPDAIGYYPKFYFMHVGIVLLLLIGSLWALISKVGLETFILFAITLLAVFWFCMSAIRWRPNRCKNMIEEDRIRWDLVFEDLASSGIKRREKTEQPSDCDK